MTYPSFVERSDFLRNVFYEADADGNGRLDRAEFEEAVLQDERNVIAAFLDETVNLFVAAAKKEVAAQLAPYVADYFKSATEFFGFLGPFAPVAAAAAATPPSRGSAPA